MNALRIVIAVALVIAIAILGFWLIDRCTGGRATAKLHSLETEVRHRDGQTSQVEQVNRGERCDVYQGDGVQVDSRGRAKLDMGGCMLGIYRDSKLDVETIPTESTPLCVAGLNGGTITSDAEKKIIVRADWAVITSVGTRFLVHMDVDRDLIWVVVTEGTVQVAAQGQRVRIEAGQQTWVWRGRPPERPRPASREEVGDLFPPIDELTNDQERDAEWVSPPREEPRPVERPPDEEEGAEPELSLTLERSTDEVFTGECGDPRSVDVIARLDGPNEAIGQIYYVLLRYGWEGGDEMSLRMERETDRFWFATLDTFDYCCQQTTLYYVVEVLDVAGNVLASGSGELRLSYCLG